MKKTTLNVSRDMLEKAMGFTNNDHAILCDIKRDPIAGHFYFEFIVDDTINTDVRWVVSQLSDTADALANPKKYEWEPKAPTNQGGEI